MICLLVRRVSNHSKHFMCITMKNEKLYFCLEFCFYHIHWKVCKNVNNAIISAPIWFLLNVVQRSWILFFFLFSLSEYATWQDSAYSFHYYSFVNLTKICFYILKLLDVCILCLSVYGIIKSYVYDNDDRIKKWFKW